MNPKGGVRMSTKDCSVKASIFIEKCAKVRRKQLICGSGRDDVYSYLARGKGSIMKEPGY